MRSLFKDAETKMDSPWSSNDNSKSSSNSRNGVGSEAKKPQVGGSSSSRAVVSPEDGPSHHVLWGSLDTSSSGSSSGNKPFKNFNRGIPNDVTVCDSSHSDDSAGRVPKEHEPIARFVSREGRNDGPVLDSDGEATSIGSKHHPRSCQPCAFLARGQKCLHGLGCVFCHRSHDDLSAKTGRSQVRQTKGERMQFRKTASELGERLATDPEAFDVSTAAGSLPGSDYVKEKLLERLQAHRNKVVAARQEEASQKSGDPPSKQATVESAPAPPVDANAYVKEQLLARMQSHRNKAAAQKAAGSGVPQPEKSQRAFAKGKLAL